MSRPSAHRRGPGAGAPAGRETGDAAATGREAADARPDRRLDDIFDDGRTPGAPETLYEFLREVPMTSETPNDRTIRRWWTGLGRGARVMASLAAVAVVAALVVVAVLGPHGDGVASPTR